MCKWCNGILLMSETSEFNLIKKKKMRVLILSLLMILPWTNDCFFSSTFFLYHLFQPISASTSLSHFCTYHNPVTFSFSVFSRIPSHNSSASFFLFSASSWPLFGLFMHSYPPFPFWFLLQYAINCIQCCFVFFIVM